MTATDELRRLLDERGVFWIDIPRGDVRRTCWKSSDEQCDMTLFVGASESYDTDAWEAYNLKKENTKLQQQLADVTESMGRVEERCAKLRELVRGLKYCAHEAYGMCARVPVGGERPFTCCPLYDFDAKKYRCEEFMLELGIEVGE